jgi:hypothetical protein
MSSRTAWTAGNGNSGAGLTWTAAFNSTDFTGAQPTNGQSLLSTITISNGSNFDQFMDVGFIQTISSSTIAQGANFSLWICSLKPDGSTYFPPLTAGTAASLVPPWAPCAVIPLFAATAQTTLVGSTADTGTPIILPPGTFKLIVQNNCGFTLTSSTQTWDYRTYNINLNS